MGLDMFLRKRNTVNGKQSEIGYWRKANHVHAWFNSHFEGEVENCEDCIVTKEMLEELLHDVDAVLADHSKAELIMPTQSGFFFGSTEYDECYYNDLKETRKFVLKALNETDFDTEEVIYHAWW